MLFFQSCATRPSVNNPRTVRQSFEEALGQARAPGFKAHTLSDILCSILFFPRTAITRRRQRSEALSRQAKSCSVNKRSGHFAGSFDRVSVNRIELNNNCTTRILRHCDVVVKSANYADTGNKVTQITKLISDTKSQKETNHGRWRPEGQR